MDGVPPTPTKPGWYWDPQELEYNLAVREAWRRQGFYLGRDNGFRLRRWDGGRWTDETVRNPQLRGINALPHVIGPTSRLHPMTPERTRRGWWIWGTAMVLAGAVAVASMVMR
jgi:hypothetical protein